MKKLLIIPGSLRAGSYNAMLARAFAARVPAGVETDVVASADIRSIPPFDDDVAAAAFPAAAAQLKARIRAADGIIVVTPEYNRSIPGVLKNAVDWTSRPYGDNAWAGKPVYVASASSGPISGALAQYELKRVMLYLDARVLGQPEFFCGNAADKFAADGTLTDAKTAEVIGTALPAFTSFIG